MLNHSRVEKRNPEKDTDLKMPECHIHKSKKVYKMMKSLAVFFLSLSAVSAFAPQGTCGRSVVSTQLRESLADKIFGMDLFAPNPTVNEYGARDKKNLKQGKLGGNSYVPAGLTLAQYEKIRAQDQQKKENNYKKNVSKAFKFQGFDEFYLKRGTQEGGKWLSAPGRGHTFTKTKYNFGEEGVPSMSDVKTPEAFTFPSIFGKKK